MGMYAPPGSDWYVYLLRVGYVHVLVGHAHPRVPTPAWTRCRRCSRSLATRARSVVARGEPACTSPCMALLAELLHSCMMVSHVTHVNVSCRRARSSLSKRLALPDGSTKKVTACRPEFARTIKRGCAGLCRRAASTSIGTATSPSSAQQSVRNAHQCGIWMSPPSHHGANWVLS